MGVTIQQLNDKYKAEDPQWDFSLFTSWLEKKGIPNTPQAPVIAETLKQVLILFNPESLPEKHHHFDHAVLALARETATKMNSALLQVLDEQAQVALKKYDAEWYSLGKFRRIWRVIRGKD